MYEQSVREHVLQWQEDRPALCEYLIIEIHTNRPSNLHQCFRIISSPLFEASPLGKASKAWECRGGCNSSFMISLEHVIKYLAYRRSISAIIAEARASVWTAERYSSTQKIRWSLNVPLMIWCKISGESRSYISARGKS